MVNARWFGVWGRAEYGAKEVAEEVGECGFGVEWGQGRRRTQLGAEEAASEE